MGTITGAELIVDSLERNEIDHVFNVPGVGIFPLVDALADSESITYVSGLSETAVSLIAEGYSRVARRPAFVNVYHSSGTALGLVGLTVAWADRTPLVFTSTTSSRRLHGRDQYAAVPDDITEVTDQYTKWSYTVPAAERVPEAIARAVTIATTPPMGPVHLGFPMDLYRETVDESAVGGEADPLEGRYPSSPARTRPLPGRDGRGAVYSDVTPSPAGLREAAAVLAESERPLIAAGGEVGQLYATDELVALAEQLGAGVVTEWRTPTYLPMPTAHPQYLGDVMEVLGAESVSAFEDADVILSVGFEFTEARVGQYPFRESDQRLVHLATDAREVGKQFPATVALLGHPKPALGRLGDRLAEADLGDVAGRRERVADQKAAVQASLDATLDGLERGDRPTPAEHTVASLREVFGEKLLLVSYPVMAGGYVSALDLDDPDGYYGISGKASAQGWAAPAAIGAQLAAPDRHVVALNGDGGFMFTSPIALYTAASYDLPVTVVVLNNRGWGGGTYDSILEHDWGDALIGKFDDPPLDFESLARGVGVRYDRIDAVDEVRGVLESARDHAGPSVVEVPMAFGDGP